MNNGTLHRDSTVRPSLTAKSFHFPSVADREKQMSNRQHYRSWLWLKGRLTAHIFTFEKMAKIRSNLNYIILYFQFILISLPYLVNRTNLGLLQ